MTHIASYPNFFNIFLEKILFIIRGEFMEERQGLKLQCLVVPPASPAGDWACSPHMCPDSE